MLADRLLVLRLQERIVSQLRGTWYNGVFVSHRTWSEVLGVDIRSASQMHDFAVANATYCRRERYDQEVAHVFQGMLVCLIMYACMAWNWYFSKDARDTSYDLD